MNHALSPVNTRVSALPNVWYAQQAHVQTIGTTLPFLQHELVLNLGDEFSISDATTADNLLFSAIRTSSIETKASGRYEALGLLFRPEGVFEHYGVSVAELQQAQSPDDLLPGPRTELLQRLDEACSVQDKIKAAKTFLTHYSHQRTVPQIVTRFLQHVALTPSHNLAELSRTLNVSSKHLRSSVRSVLGVSPKKYLHLVQLQHALNAMASTPKLSMTDCALSSGFYDQAHFNRVFRKLTGMAPGAYYRSANRGKFGECHTLIH